MDFPGTITNKRCLTPATNATKVVLESEFNTYIAEYNYSIPYQSVESLLRKQ